jgi:hypothetical protein
VLILIRCPVLFIFFLGAVAMMAAKSCNFYDLTPEHHMSQTKPTPN